MQTRVRLALPCDKLSVGTEMVFKHRNAEAAPQRIAIGSRECAISTARKRQDCARLEPGCAERQQLRGRTGQNLGCKFAQKVHPVGRNTSDLRARPKMLGDKRNPCLAGQRVFEWWSRETAAGPGSFRNSGGNAERAIRREGVPGTPPIQERDSHVTSFLRL